VLLTHLVLDARSISWRELLEDFVAVGRPLLLLQPYDEPTVAAELEAWALPNLLRRHGNTTVTRSSIPYLLHTITLNNTSSKWTDL
jgi:alpha-beta hydrolase superfamily lysophospholipase